VVITQVLLREIVDHARAHFPEEACGMLAFKGGRVASVRPLRNAAASPVRYEIDSRDLLTQIEIEDQGCELGIFHSHPRTAAYPSPTDVELAFDPDALYVIVSLAYPEAPVVRAFRIRDGQIAEEPVTIET
jgi:proteasome lid subunit RPN8/RPN11